MAAFTETQREEFLAGKHVAVLSVAATDGRPPASGPIWYGYTPGGNILVNNGVASRKTKLLGGAGVGTLAAKNEDPPYQYVIVEGTVVDSVSPAPLDVRVDIATRYLGDEGGRAFGDGLKDEAGILAAA